MLAARDARTLERLDPGDLPVSRVQLDAALRLDGWCRRNAHQFCG